MHVLFHYVGAHHPSTAAQVVLPSHVHSIPGPCSPQNTENPLTSGLQKYFLYIAEQPEIRPVIKTLCFYEHVSQPTNFKVQVFLGKVIMGSQEFSDFKKQTISTGI
jgi:hypothetical protein